MRVSEFPFKIKPFEHQIQALKTVTNLKGKAALFMEPGCVAGETVIQGPDGNERIDRLAARGQPIRVWSLAHDGRIVSSKATAPFKKGVADLYEFILVSGRSIRVTDHHRFLTPSGWRFASELSVGDEIATSSHESPLSASSLSADRSKSVVCLRASRPEHVPLTRGEGVVHSSQTLLSSQASCFDDHRLYDGRLLEGQDNDREPSPLQDDALVHGCGDLRGGDQDNKSAHTRVYQSSYLPSRPDFDLLHYSFDAGTRRSLVERASSLFRVSHQCNVQPGYNSIPDRRGDGSPQRGTRAGDGQSEAWGFSFDTVVSIQYIRTDAYYDMHVPRYENYLANGVWNHNTGKSQIAVSFANFAFLSEHGNKFLVVCPLSVIGVWEREIAAHTPNFIKHTVRRLTGNSENKVRTLKRLAQLSKPNEVVWIVTNYETIWRGGFGKSRLKPNDPGNVLQALLGFQFDLGVIDEGHRLKDPRTNQSRAAHQIGERLKMRLLLTGTPITNNPLDLYSQMKFVDPLVFSTEIDSERDVMMGGNVLVRVSDRRAMGEKAKIALSWTAFKAKYAETGGFGGYQIKAYRNLDDLYTRVRQVSFVRKKEECLDLPEKIFETIPIELSPKTREAYVQMATQMIAFVEHAEERVRKIRDEGIDIDTGEEIAVNRRRGRSMAVANAAIVKILRLYQIACGFVKDENDETITIGSEKVDATIDLLDDLLAAGEKVVIFARFRHDIERLQAALTRREIGHVSVWGDVKERDRTSGIERFQTDPKIKVAVCQIAAGSLGITLTAARTVIFYSVDYSFGNFYQACDRIHRIGQTKKCQYFMLVAQNTIEEDVYNVIFQKQELADVFLKRPLAFVESLRKKLNLLQRTNAA